MTVDKYRVREDNRIVALRKGIWGDIGTVGGFIFDSAQLSQEGDCWLYDHSHIHGNAVVKDHAALYDKASLEDEAVLTGNAVVKVNATVKEQAYMEQDSCLSGNACLKGTAYLSNNNHVSGKTVISIPIALGTDALINKQRDILVIGPVGIHNQIVVSYKTNKYSWLVHTDNFTGKAEDLDKKLSKEAAKKFIGTFEEKRSYQKQIAAVFHSIHVHSNI